LAVKNQRSIRVGDILSGPDRIVGRLGHLQIVLRRNGAIFGPSSLRAPSSMLDPEGNGRIERTAINAGLSS
jgi:hypothetical protein